MTCSRCRAALSLLAAALVHAGGADTLVTVVFTGKGPLGIAFRKGVTPLTIRHVSPETLAASQSQLRPGMQLVAVSDMPTLDGVGYDDSISFLRCESDKTAHSFLGAAANRYILVAGLQHAPSVCVSPRHQANLLVASPNQEDWPGLASLSLAASCLRLAPTQQPAWHYEKVLLCTRLPWRRKVPQT